MNKLFAKIAGLTLGLAMAIGVGVAVSSKKSVSSVFAAEDDQHEISSFTGKGVGVLLNDNGAPSTITVDDPGYVIKQVIIGWTHNKSNDGITATVKVGTTTLGSGKVGGTKATTTTTIGDGLTSLAGAVEISFVNKMTGTGKGTLTLNSLTLLEGSGKTLSSISIKTAPTKVVYNEGDFFEPAGLVITKTFDDSSEEDLTYTGNESKFTFSPSLSTALATTDTSISVTVSKKTAYQAITVNADTLQTISLSGSVKGYKNQPWDLSGVVVTGHYSSGLDRVITTAVPETSTAIPKAAGDYVVHVTCTVDTVFGEEDFIVTVTNAHSGLTPEDAFTVTEAIEHKFASKTVVTDLYYVTGELTADPYNTQYGNFYISDGSNQITVYGCTETDSSLAKGETYWNFTNPKDFATGTLTKDLAAGWTVIMKSRIYAYNTSTQIDGVCVSSSAPVASSLAIKTAPTKVVYSAGEFFDPTGLEVTVTYSTGSTEDIAYAGNESLFTFTPGLATALQTTDVSVNIEVKSVSTSQAITVTAPVTDWTFKSLDLVAGAEAKLEYYVGSSFNDAGFTVTLVEHSATAGIDRQTDVKASSTFNGFDSSAAGTCQVYATYNTHDSNKINITIKEIVGFARLDNAAELVPGMVIRFGATSTSGSFAATSRGSNKYLSSEAATIADGVMTSTDKGVDYRVGGSEGAWTFTNADEILTYKSLDFVDAETADSYTTFTVSIDSSNGNATISGTGGASGNKILYNVSSPRFKLYGSSTVISDTLVLPQIYVVSLPTAESWATSFLSATGTVCSSGSDDNLEALKAIWDDQEAAYNALSVAEKANLVDSSASENIKNALARYDYICGKYNKSSTNLNEFIVGHVVPSFAVLAPIDNASSVNTPIIIVVCCAVASITALGILLVIKRRKYSVK